MICPDLKYIGNKICEQSLMAIHPIVDGTFHSKTQMSNTGALEEKSDNYLGSEDTSAGNHDCL